MVHISIVCVGKIKEQYLKDAISEYSKRLSRYCNLSFTELPDKKIPDKANSSLEAQVINTESDDIIAHLSSDSYNICLDLKGKELSSPEFANKLQEIQQINSTINFVIGGSLGFNDKVRTKCKESICFSKMTFPHQLIRVFLLEQIYRAFKINNNETYHK